MLYKFSYLYSCEVYLFKVRDGVSRVLDVESGDAVRTEENGHDDEDGDEDRDVGERQTSK